MADKKSPLYRGIGSYEGEGSFQMKSPILRKGVYGAPIQKNYSPLTAKEGEHPVRWFIKGLDLVAKGISKGSKIVKKYLPKKTKTKQARWNEPQRGSRDVQGKRR